MGASTIAIRPLQDFQAKVEGGRLFDIGGSTVNYGNYKFMTENSISAAKTNSIILPK